MPKVVPLDRGPQGGPAFMFHCPACECGHWFQVGDGPGPRWTWNDDFERPTVTPSIFVNPPCAIKDHELGPSMHRCHSFVRDGSIQFLGDCTHALAGKTVPIPDFWEA